MAKRRSSVGATVLWLDDLITDPDAAPVLAAFQERLDRTPVGLRDQIDAALAETRQIAKVMDAAGLIEQQVTMKHGDHPSWVRLGALKALLTWASGGGSTCLHSPTPRRPQPIYAVAWRPDLVVCVQCMHLTRLQPRSVRDLTCDGCGKVTKGARTDVPLWTSMVHLGVLTFGFGACGDCKYWPDDQTIQV